MHTSTTASAYTGHRFPQEIISHAIWLSNRFSLSYRAVEEVLAERGIVVTSETVRQWWLKFGQPYANQLRRRRPKTGEAQAKTGARVSRLHRGESSVHSQLR